MCYGSGCIYEDYRGECRKPRKEACPLDEDATTMDFWDKVDEAYERKLENERIARLEARK